MKAFKSTFNELIDTTTYTTLLYELEYQNDIMKSSYEYNLYEILEKKGFVITKNNKKNVTLKDDEKKPLKKSYKKWRVPPIHYMALPQPSNRITTPHTCTIHLMGPTPTVVALSGESIHSPVGQFSFFLRP